MNSTTSRRKFPEPVDYGAAHTSNNELHGHELRKPLTKQQRGKCYREVPSNLATCPNCKEAQK